MYLRGDFTNMMLIMIPVLVNTVIIVLVIWYNNTWQKVISI